MVSPRAALLVLLLLATSCSDGRTSTPSPAASPSPSTLQTSATPLPEDPLSPRPAVESPAPLGQPTCAPAAVTVTDADAVITDRVQEVYVLRTAGPPCQLEGFPAVTLLDADGRDLGVTVTRSTATPRSVTLSTATSLSFTLTTGRTGDCRQAAALRVVLPGTAAAITAATELRACGPVQTGPVQRLEDDEDEGAGG